MQNTSTVLLSRAGKLQHHTFLPKARRLVWILFILALANGIFLYLVPQLAETHYAWAIKPPINAAFMGAGYAAGMVATGLALFKAKHWRSVRLLFPGFFTLGLSLLVATLLHVERFKWNYPLTWIWTLVYLSIPVGSVMIWYWHERADKQLSARDPRLRFTRGLSLFLGVVLTASATLLYFAPPLFLEVWPWQITPLLARVFAGWYFLGSIILVTTGVTLRQAHELPISFATLVAWNMLSLLLIILYSDSVRFATAGFWVWTVLHVVFLVFTTWVTLKALAVMSLEQHSL
jgi:hypothetical protein